MSRLKQRASQWCMNGWFHELFDPLRHLSLGTGSVSLSESREALGQSIAGRPIGQARRCGERGFVVDDRSTIVTVSFVGNECFGLQIFVVLDCRDGPTLECSSSAVCLSAFNGNGDLGGDDCRVAGSIGQIAGLSKMLDRFGGNSALQGEGGMANGPRWLVLDERGEPAHFGLCGRLFAFGQKSPASIQIRTGCCGTELAQIPVAEQGGPVRTLGLGERLPKVVAADMPASRQIVELPEERVGFGSVRVGSQSEFEAVLCSTGVQRVAAGAAGPAGAVLRRTAAMSLRRVPTAQAPNVRWQERSVCCR